MGNDNDAMLAALRLALPELEADLNSLVECCSRLRQVTAEIEALRKQLAADRGDDRDSAP
jgi:hypothetical protein